MRPIDELIEAFRKFPGVGPRQAGRFAYHLLTSSPSSVKRIAELIGVLQQDMAMCENCRRYFHRRRAVITLCDVCSDKSRDNSLLAVVCRDTDLDALEKSGTFKGRYFVLGGTIPILDSESSKHIRLKELLEYSKHLAENGSLEIILAMNATPEGEHTDAIVRKALTALSSEYAISVSTLGRGLSTGTELEYADRETLKSALKNRSNNVS